MNQTIICKLISYFKFHSIIILILIEEEILDEE